MSSSKEIDHYELELIIVGRDYRDTIKIEADDPLGLEFKIVKIGDQEFQRYGDDVSYDDVRSDWIVARRFTTVYKESSPVTRIVPGPDVADSERSLPDLAKRTLDADSTNARSDQRGESVDG